MRGLVGGARALLGQHVAGEGAEKIAAARHRRQVLDVLDETRIRQLPQHAGPQESDFGAPRCRLFNAAFNRFRPLKAPSVAFNR